MRADFARLNRVFALIPWGMRRSIVLLILAAALTAILDMAAVVAMLPLTQVLTGGGEIPASVTNYLVPVIGTSDRSLVLLSLALFVGLAFMAKNVALIAIRWWAIGTTTRASTSVQATLLKRYVSAPYSQHRMRSKAVMLQNLTAAAPATLNVVLLGYITMAVDALTILLLFATMVVLSPLGSIAAILIFGGAGLLISRVLKPAALRYAWRSMDLETEAWRIINPAIEGFRESRIFRRESLFVDRYRVNRERFAQTKRPQTLLGELPKYLLEIVMVFGILVVALLLFTTQPESTAFGLLAVFAAASIRIIPALNRLVATYNGVRSGRPYLAAVDAEVTQLDEDEASGRGRHEQSVDFSSGLDIVVDGLGFHYQDSEEMVLSDVDVTIRRGSTVALVGSSGAGKTTFADILVGLLEATEGSVSVGPYDIAEYPNSWRRDVAMVSQKVYLWEATIRDLITFSQPPSEVDQKHLDEVVRRARLDTLIAGMPEGLDTVVGDSGARISGGQAQRIGIARALYARPKVLVLDEATSALDNETEYEITRTLNELRGEVTVIVVAHRLSTVKSADEILFFSRGKLRSRGTMAELRATDSDFARLVELGSLE